MHLWAGGSCSSLITTWYLRLYISMPPTAHRRSVKPNDLELAEVEEAEFASGSESDSEEEGEADTSAANRETHSTFSAVTPKLRIGPLESLFKRRERSSAPGEPLASSPSSGFPDSLASLLAAGGAGGGGRSAASRLASALTAANLAPGCSYVLQLDDAGALWQGVACRAPESMIFTAEFPSFADTLKFMTMSVQDPATGAFFVALGHVVEESAVQDNADCSSYSDYTKTM